MSFSIPFRLPQLTLAAAIPALKGARQFVPRVGFSSLGLWMCTLIAVLFVYSLTANAAGSGGTALQAAYTTVNDMIGGYGKQLLVTLGFIVASIGYLAANATSVIMKFIGYAIFLGVGLSAAVSLVGAVI